MPSPDPPLQFVSGQITEVALRANRLRELVDLGDLYRQVDGSCRALARSVNTTPSEWGQHKDIWLGLRNQDLQILFDFVQNTEHIRQKVRMEIQAGVGVTVDQWIAQLEKLSTDLEKVMRDEAKAILSDATMQLQGALLAQIGRHKRLIETEVEHLVFVTQSLRDRLKGSSADGTS